jgi:peptidoglycan/xylan/chitin deacetylase (PgdA/CDA1 family)
MWHHKSWRFGKIVFSMFLTTTFMSRLAQADPLSTLRMNNQIQQQIQSTLEAHEAASTYQEWLESPDHPRNWSIHQDISSQPWRTNVIQGAFCQELLSLNTTDLVTFYSELDQARIPVSENCQSLLIQSVDSYMQQARVRLEQKYGALDQAPPTAPSLRSLERDLDVTGGPVFFHADMNTKELLFTFDDGPHSRLTTELLDTLDEYQMKAIFFVVGRLIRVNPDVLQETLHRGHEIGGHTVTHPDLRRLSFDRAYNEIENGFKMIVDTLGTSSPYFRFPYGAYTRELRSQLKRDNIASFFWNIDTLDWKKKDPEVLYEYALKQIENAQRGVVLFHDIQPQTITIMPWLLKALSEKGYKSVILRPTDDVTRDDFE